MTIRLRGLFVAVAVGCLALTSPTDAALEGGTIATTQFFGVAPDQTTVFGPVTSVIGAGVELNNFGVAGFVDIDFSDTNILITLTMDQPFGYFDVLRFSDLNGTLPDFGNVTLNPASNYDGFTASRIRVEPDLIDVNLTALSGLHGQRISLDLTAVSPALPAPWASRDVGAVGTRGSATHSAGIFVVDGAGADIWGSVDSFHYAYRPWTGDGSIVARVDTVAGSQPWTKAGVMIRQSLAAGSAHASMLVTSGKGLAFQRRTVAGALSTHTSGGSGTAPRWVKLTRAGSVITASVSSDGRSWRQVGHDLFSMAGSVFVGLAVTSHDSGQLATGTFDHVAVAPLALPAGWRRNDVGSVGRPGSTSASGGTFTLSGAGADVWGRADAFHYAWRVLSGDGAIVARVATLADGAVWTKAGVMIRESVAAGSPHAFLLVSKARGLAFQRRTEAGALSTHTSAGTGIAPQWIKLARMGPLVTASVSTDGTTWRVVGSDVISMSIEVLVGLAVTSHDTSQLAVATFDRIAVSP